MCFLAGDAPQEKPRPQTAPTTQPARDQFDELMKKYLDLTQKLHKSDDLPDKSALRKQLHDLMRELHAVKPFESQTLPPVRPLHPFVIDPIPNWRPPAGSVPHDFNGERYWIMPLSHSPRLWQPTQSRQTSELEMFDQIHRRTPNRGGALILPNDPQHVNNRSKN
jgi:hypothetical protein